MEDWEATVVLGELKKNVDCSNTRALIFRFEDLFLTALNAGRLDHKFLQLTNFCFQLSKYP